MNRGFRNCPLCRSPLPRLTPEEKAESRARYYRRCLCGATLVTIRNGRDWTTEIYDWQDNYKGMLREGA